MTRRPPTHIRRPATQRIDLVPDIERVERAIERNIAKGFIRRLEDGSFEVTEAGRESLKGDTTDD